MNVFILIRIIYILIKKLRARHHKKSIQYMKAVRATFILVPLLGIQFLLAGWEPRGRTIKEIHQYVVYIFIFYQVSSLFKYMQFTMIAKECCRYKQWTYFNPFLFSSQFHQMHSHCFPFICADFNEG